MATTTMRSVVVPARAVAAARPCIAARSAAAFGRAAPARVARPARGGAGRVHAMGATELGMLLADAAAPGSVDAPGWVLPVALAVVTVAGSLSVFLLKPGEQEGSECDAMPCA